MTQQQPNLGRLDHLTFKGNLRNTRYGWLRLTPAYSVHLVAELLEREWQPGTVVLDPFCGTGTTALVCAERGVECDRYWLGYLSDGRQAGELDWEAIGGTWGCATSNVSKWVPEKPVVVPYDDFEGIVSAITATSKVLGRYVAKYFHDMVMHCESLFSVVASGGSVHYIVGNSKFYDVMLPVERIYAAMFSSVGFRNVQIKTIRKRSSKKELFEFVVSATKP